MIIRPIQEIPCEQRKADIPALKAKSEVVACFQANFKLFPPDFQPNLWKRGPVSHSVFHFFHRVFNISSFLKLYAMYSFFQIAGSFWWEKGRFFLFYKRKSRFEIYFLWFLDLPKFSYLRTGIKSSPVFHIFSAQNPRVENRWKALVFHKKRPPLKTGAKAQNLTSYCGKPALRSGNTGSGCRHRRWWW